MVTERMSIEDAAELRTENVIRVGVDERERAVEWCRENVKGHWQLIKRSFTGEDEEVMKEAARRERARAIRYTRGSAPLVYRFDVWELRIDDAAEAASARLTLT
ncbi:MAG: hypothetical protein HY060_23700 [Proteobacteria bacterium]|nr:hypothetical protein [Pseudomonadota bacterium]